LPHRETSIKLMKVTKALMMLKLETVLKEVKALVGPPYAGVQSDVWSTKACRDAYLALRLSLVVPHHICYPVGGDPSGATDGLLEINPLAGFRLFREGSHTGKVLSRAKTGVLASVGMRADYDVSLFTEDGASNNKKSLKLLSAPYKVCGPHDHQTAVLAAIGMGRKKFPNEALKALIMRGTRMNGSFNKSVVHSIRLRDCQVAEGVATHRTRVRTCPPTPPSHTASWYTPHTPPSCTPLTLLPPPPTQVCRTMNATRWDGVFKMSQINRLLQLNQNEALTGDPNGVASEDAAEPCVVAGADSSDVDSSDADESPPLEARRPPTPLARTAWPRTT
jgi:hypothetical protein